MCRSKARVCRSLPRSITVAFEPTLLLIIAQYMKYHHFAQVAHGHAHAAAADAAAKADAAAAAGAAAGAAAAASSTSRRLASAAKKSALKVLDGRIFYISYCLTFNRLHFETLDSEQPEYINV